MNGTQTMAEATVPFEYSAPFEYSVPVDPMDELQCDSCQ
ncbi:MAG: hypothetical protein QOG18_1263 [Microbacteriaceae bacterium]|jgi:hypothetical protein|nr:hypothetical protein [Microbacteriaceae bacterium]